MFKSNLSGYLCLNFAANLRFLMRKSSNVKNKINFEAKLIALLLFCGFIVVDIK